MQIEWVIVHFLRGNAWKLHHLLKDFPDNKAEFKKVLWDIPLLAEALKDNSIIDICIYNLIWSTSRFSQCCHSWVAPGLHRHACVRTCTMINWIRCVCVQSSFNRPLWELWELTHIYLLNLLLSNLLCLLCYHPEYINLYCSLMLL